MSESRFQPEIIIYTGPSSYHIKQIHEWLKSRQVCKGLNRGYIKDVLETCWFFIYITMNGDIHGIVIVHPDIPDLNSMKIDVLCGSTKYSGTGTILLNMVSYITEIIGNQQLFLHP